ncbi:hypothetical protein V8C35DRAFT_285634 [Trichoderma chlorosporum]
MGKTFSQFGFLSPNLQYIWPATGGRRCVTTSKSNLATKTMATALGDTSTTQTTVQCFDTAPSNCDIPLLKISCSSSKEALNDLNPVMHPSDVTSDGPPNITVLNVEDSSVGEHKQSIEDSPFQRNSFRPYLPLQNETSVPYGLVSNINDGQDQLENLSACTEARDNTKTRLIRQISGIFCAEDVIYQCVTEKNGCAEICIGWNYEIPRWRRDSKLTYTICKESFPDDLMPLVAEAMRKAIGMWKNVNVSFKEVRRDDPATFAVIYRKGYNPNAYACSFFPNESLRELTVYEKSREVPDYLANILAHEIGHILGLRHEFAHGRGREVNNPCIRVGPDNAQSVMNYFENPKQNQVQKQDLEDFRKILDHRDLEYEGWFIRDIDPEDRYFLENFGGHPTSSSNSAAIDAAHTRPIGPYLRRLNVSTTMQHGLYMRFLMNSILFMMLAMLIINLCLILYLVGSSFLIS